MQCAEFSIPAVRAHSAYKELHLCQRTPTRTSTLKTNSKKNAAQSASREDHQAVVALPVAGPVRVPAVRAASPAPGSRVVVLAPVRAVPRVAAALARASAAPRRAVAGAAAAAAVGAERHNRWSVAIGK